jgi:hypothetical protein
MLGISLDKSINFIKSNSNFILLIWVLSSLSLCFVGWLETTPLKDNAVASITINLAASFFNIWLFVSMIHRIKDQAIDGGDETYGESLLHGLYSAPGYILVALGYSLMLLVGLFLLVIPGVWVGANFVFAPTLAVFDISADEMSYSHSQRLVQGNFMIGLLFAILSIIMESSSQLIVTIGEGMGLTLLFYVPMFFVLMALGVLVECWSSFTVIELVKSKLAVTDQQV